MKISRGYQSNKRKHNLKKWKNEDYFNINYNLITKNLPVSLAGKILDAGCYKGKLLEVIKKNNPDITPYGVDIFKKGCQMTKERGFLAKEADLNSEIPFPDNFFNFIISQQVIEHLINPDKFLEECYRALKYGGYLIISTPNLASWYYRVLFLLGYHPLSMELSTKDHQVGIGLLKHIIKNKQPVGHIRVFTNKALKDIMNLYNFRVIKTKGVASPFSFPPIIQFFYDSLDFLFSLSPSFSSNLLIIVKKE